MTRDAPCGVTVEGSPAAKLMPGFQGRYHCAVPSLESLMTFAARERMINLYAITATSFRYHPHSHYVTDLSQGFAACRKLILQARYSSSFGQFGTLKYFMRFFGTV